jgi:hypothetical protein
LDLSLFLNVLSRKNIKKILAIGLLDKENKKHPFSPLKLLSELWKESRIIKLTKQRGSSIQ